MRFIDLVNHFLTYWPIAMVGGFTGLIGWAMWRLSISVDSTRWKKAIQKGAYADAILKEHLALLKTKLLISENKNVFLKNQNTRYRKAIQSMTSTAQRATVILLEEEKADE